MTVRRIGRNFSYIKIEDGEVIYVPKNQQMVTVDQINIEADGELEVIELESEVVIL